MKKSLFLISFLFISQVASSQNEAFFVLDIAGLTSDSIELRVEVNDVIWKWDIYNLSLLKGQYRGVLPIRKPSFFYVKDKKNFVHGWVEPGDSIFIKYDAMNMGKTLMLSGTKANVMRLQNQLIQLRLRERVKAQLPAAKMTAFPFDYLLHYLDSLENFYVSALHKENSHLSNEAMIALTGYIKAQFLTNYYHSVTIVHSESVNKTIETRTEELTDYSLKKIRSL